MGLEIALSSVTITKAELEPVVTWTTSTCHVWLHAEHRSFVAACAPCIFGGKCVVAVQMLTHWHDFGGFLVTFQKLMFSLAEEPLYILVKQKKCFMFSHTEWCSFARDLMLWPATQFKFKQKGLPCGCLHVSSYLCFVSAISVYASRMIFLFISNHSSKITGKKHQAGCDFTAVECRQLWSC